MRVTVGLAAVAAIGVCATPAAAADWQKAQAVRPAASVQEEEPAPAPPSSEQDPGSQPSPEPDLPMTDQWGFGGVEPGGIVAGAGGTPVSAGPDGRVGGSGAGRAAPQRPIDCLVIELDPSTEGIGSVTPGLQNADVERADAVVEGGRYYQECWYVDTGDLFYADVWDQGPPGQPGVNPRVLAQSALSREPFTVPVPGMAPAMDGEQITGLPTWLWLDPSNWAPIEAEASAAGVSVTVTATPVRVEWDMGDGTVVECDGPGVVWNPDGPNPDDTDCSHVFQDTSVDEPDGRYAGSVSIVWSIAWQANTGESGTLPEGRSSSPFSLLVNEMQAVVTYDS